jgi:hypothetical protein
MISLLIAQADIINEIVEFLMSHAWSLIAIPIAWFIIMLLYKKFIEDRPSAWDVLMCLLVAIGVVVGLEVLNIIP